MGSAQGPGPIVEYPFTTDEWEALTKSERAHRCRLLGDEVLGLAERTT